MPTAPLTFCTHAGCPNLVHGKGSRCPGHARPSSRARGYGGPEWEAARREVLERDGGICQECGRPGRQIAHIVARSKGGPDTPDNLRVLCDSCHARETALETRFGRVDAPQIVRGRGVESDHTCPRFSGREIGTFFDGKKRR